MGRNVLVLICCPSLSAAGGVANYYRVIKRKLDCSSVEFLENGGEKKRGGALLRTFISEPVCFLHKLVQCRPKVVCLNPSLKSHAILRNAVFLLFSKIFNKKVVVFWRGFDLDTANSIYKNSFARFAFGKIFNSADITLVLAKEFRSQLRKFNIDHPIFTTTTVVDPELFISSFPPIRNGLPRLLFLSRLEKKKGIYEAIKAFIQLKEKYPDLRMEVVGDGPEGPRLKRLYSSETGIFFHGHVDGPEKVKIMARCDILLFPSYTEGMPNSVLEAMAAGLAIITTPVGGLLDFFIPGKHGFFVKRKCHTEITCYVRRLLNDRHLLERISMTNTTYAKNNFSAQKRSNFLLTICDAVSTECVAKLPSDWIKRK